MNRAVFLDRDGVINALVYRADEGVWDSPYSLEEFELLPGTTQALKMIKEAGFLAVVVSNQPGVAKAKCSLEFLEQLNQRLQAELAQAGASLDAIHYCLHHPNGVVRTYVVSCLCRKPNPGLLLQAAAQHSIDLQRSYMIGDSLVDIQAGHSAGCTTILIDKPAASDRDRGNVRPQMVATSLLDAATQIRQKELQHGDFSRLS